MTVCGIMANGLAWGAVIAAIYCGGEGPADTWQALATFAAACGGIVSGLLIVVRVMK